MRTLVIAIALCLCLGAAAAPTAAAEDPDPRPMDCEVVWEPFLAGTDPIPDVDRPVVKCYT